MSWTYGLIKHGEEDYRVHEMYFDERGVWDYTKEAISMDGESKDDVLLMLKNATKDIKHNPIWVKENLDKSLVKAPWELGVNDESS